MFLFIFYAETLLIPSVSSSVIAIHIPAKQPVIHRQTQKISTGLICHIEKSSNFVWQFHRYHHSQIAGLQQWKRNRRTAKSLTKKSFPITNTFDYDIL
jgi:hypothetical protein